MSKIANKTACTQIIPREMRPVGHERSVRWDVAGGLLVLVLAALPMRPAHSATLFACVNNVSGALHIVAPGTTCNSNERLVSFGC
jgi:hypothetical protein